MNSRAKVLSIIITILLSAGYANAVKRWHNQYVNTYDAWYDPSYNYVFFGQKSLKTNPYNLTNFEYDNIGIKKIMFHNFIKRIRHLNSVNSEVFFKEFPTEITSL